MAHKPTITLVYRELNEVQRMVEEQANEARNRDDQFRQQNELLT